MPHPPPFFYLGPPDRPTYLLARMIVSWIASTSLGLSNEQLQRLDLVEEEVCVGVLINELQVATYY